jgi:hypothetical protein
MDEIEQAPGSFEIDLVTHCGHILKGQFAWTLAATNVFTDWIENVVVRNRAYKWVGEAIDTISGRLSYSMAELDLR